jgi:hypothetical protein
MLNKYVTEIDFSKLGPHEKPELQHNLDTLTVMLTCYDGDTNQPIDIWFGWSIVDENRIQLDLSRHGDAIGSKVKFAVFG